MITIPGYRIDGELYTNPHTVIYRGMQLEEQKPVILKTLTPTYPTPARIAQLLHEAEILKNLNLPGIVKLYKLEKYNHFPVLILEDFGGISLKDFLSTNQLELQQFLQIGIKLAETLGQLHENHIIHKDIKPSNIIVNIQTGDVKITDFAIASLLPGENPTLAHPHLLEGTLAYLSPEQTGRMNRAIDYRTDFYSLGVTFYEMLCGELPFNAIDPMELVHCHIAKTPVSPGENRKQKVKGSINQTESDEIPLAVDDIVMKLLAKTAEDRYKSAFGLLYDLENCLAQLQTSGAISHITLGEQDRSTHLQISQKLYGREAEVNLLLNTFDRMKRGYTEILLISGCTGLGKSSLVYEIYQPILRENGYFIDSKFEKFKRDIPYAFLLQAFQDLLQQILTETAAKVLVWKQKILNALGSNCQVIIEVIPEVELIVGSQPSVPDLGSNESQNRFNLVFQKFIRIFTQKAHPLVIFLDDLQWIDSASLKLIQLLATDMASQYLLIIGAYRESEVDANHPVMLAAETIRKAGGNVSTIALLPLDINSVNQLVADTLSCAPEKSLPLGQLLFHKTGGNPFFIAQLLKSLYSQKMLQFKFVASENSVDRAEPHLSDFAEQIPEQAVKKCKITGEWQWDIEQIQEIGITDNVVELMIDNIQKLSGNTQELLTLAACIGNKFDLAILSQISEQPLTSAATHLWEAVQSGLILPVNNAYKIPIALAASTGLTDQISRDVTDELSLPVADAGSATYKFLHERVQQAAYALISESQKQEIHLKIGRFLLQNAHPEQLENHIFDLVNQLNAAQPIISSELEKLHLCKLNLMAGRKAKASAAYELAVKYLAAGIALLPMQSWQTDYDLTLALYESAAEAAYLNTDFEQMEKWAKIVLQYAKNELDKIKVFEIRITACAMQTKLQEAVTIGRESLTMLGINFPKSPTPLHIQQALTKTSAYLTGKKIEDLIDLPMMTEPRKLATMRVLSSMLSATSIVEPILLPLIVCEQVNLSINYGNSAFSAFGYANYGAILKGIVRDIESGERFGQLALNLIARLNALEFKSKTLNLVAFILMHGKHHVKDTLPLLEEAYQSALENGDLESVGYSAVNICQSLYFIGQELPQLERKMVNYNHLLFQLKQETVLTWNQIYWQTVLQLMGKMESPDILLREAYSEKTLLPLLLKVNDRVGLQTFYLQKLILAYLFGNVELALENAAQAEVYLDGVVGFINVPEYHFYDSLARLAAYPSATKEVQEEHLFYANTNLKKMQKKALSAPMNLQHKCDLIAAEKARILGDIVRAMEYYDSAIAGAQTNGYIQVQALAAELAGAFYLSIGRERIAKTYLTEARYCYQRWGAKAKVAHLESKYSQLLTSPSISTNIETHKSTSSACTTSDGAGVLDLTTAVKASQTLAGEIVLDKLLAKLMKIVIENAGGQKGFLILEKSGQWVIEASGSVDVERVNVMQSIPIDFVCEDREVTLLAVSVVNYVARTQESIVLNDATREGQFTRAPYIIAVQPKSILCTPLIHQGKLSGILYLENNLTTGAFTPDRLELLKLLSSQISISIENAQLYMNLQQFNQNLENLVQQRTCELSQTLEDLKSAQNKLVEAEKMAALGGLVAGVAHEINTPIGVGITAASLLAEKVTKFLDLYSKGQIKRSELEKFLDTALQSSNMILSNLTRAADLIHSFKEVAVDQSSELKRTFNVKNYLEEILTSLSAKLRRTKHKVEIKCDENIVLDSYPGVFSQIVTNLVLNSLIHAYDGENGGILAFDLKLEGDRLIFEYADNGKGITPENLSKIFEPFFTTKRGQGGTGLGLHIIYNLVTQKLKGRIRCESQVQKGTKFMIEFPVIRRN
ncbi:MAG: AAA family ATPase [Microcoleus sp. PH2017_01_SCD_O_A]|uniref:trifunctional serine/threonine-protein kinase/ATP-binding protein/sensor histidine kinase n=1 Tax=Microcoleus sp. PH2017_01_SCD_O_A TaxID=2798812 RepID=UPI001DFD7CDA|nr:ATP-binding sensor histidine kinase [Microcoleus sp. PH2017_01_SCD_O_A]MCC3424442.1 AAA family ATPase [Microcoleus sp. PH2017_01_SCD_O_A]TAG66718.1 MAG: GAF domain-containing protein [Oscillatoriales cyanobacterium]